MTARPSKWMIMPVELHVGRLIVRKILPDVLSLIRLSAMIVISLFITAVRQYSSWPYLGYHKSTAQTLHRPVGRRHSSFFYNNDAVIRQREFEY